MFTITLSILGTILMKKPYEEFVQELLILKPENRKFVCVCVCTRTYVRTCVQSGFLIHRFQ